MVGLSLVPVLSPAIDARRGAAPALLAAPLLGSWLGDTVADGDPSVGLREMPAFTLARRSVLAKPLHRAGPAVWGPQTGSSALGTLGSGLGVSGGGSHPERCRGVKEGGEQAGFAGSHLLLSSCASSLPRPCGASRGVEGCLWQEGPSVLGSP